LETREIQVERKQFTAALKENPRGRFVRITESGSGRANSIVIPSTGLREFQKMLEEMIKASAEIPAANPAPGPEKP
jgi:PurA ssDNA and RNA-binding protein